MPRFKIKILLTIIILCSASESFAENYICESEKQFYLHKDSSNSWNSDVETDSVNMVIDTTRGFNLSGITPKGLVGTCRYSSYGGYFCTWRDNNTLFQIIVEELANGIFFTYTDLSPTRIMNSDGSCKKIWVIFRWPRIITSTNMKKLIQFRSMLSNER